MSWANLPSELRDRAQWCLAAPPGMFSSKGKEPLTVAPDGNVYLAKSTEPSMWLTFNAATAFAGARGWHVGYMLSSDDPFTCIDFDIKDAANAPEHPERWTTREQYDFYLDSIKRFDSYTEHSASGKGFHVWAKGKIGAGIHRNGIEIYSQERFMISTGFVVNNKPIEPRETMLLSFAEHIRPKTIGSEVILDDLEPEEDDWYVFATAGQAANEEKFWALWKGKWQELGYPSQSEADFALISMLTFYSKSNSQVRRMFRMSELGKREKATKNNDYINRSLRHIRAREKAEHSVDLSSITLSAELLTKIERQKQDQTVAEMVARLQGNSESIPLHVAGPAPPPPPLPNTAAHLALAAPVPASVLSAGEFGVPWPPGVAGRIAQFIYGSSPRPVKEVSIVATLGLLAGLCGKGWHIGGSGLNLYIVLIARSAIGKEAMHSGISYIVKAVTATNPIFHQFVVFDDFASGPALTKACTFAPSFVNVSGEWGHKLRRIALADSGRDQSMQTLRQQMTNLYQKSGPKAIVGGIRYSQADNNIASVSGVAYSMIGETTPSTFYEALTENMMEDGFLSRFLNIEHNGIRPPSNDSIVDTPNSALVELLSNLATVASKVCSGSSPSIEVKKNPDVVTIMKDFEEECDKNINKTQDESFRQMWNRAALKAGRVASLLAVADHHLFPCITADHLNWAIDLVRRDISIMQRRIEGGDVGVTDTTRERKMLSVIKFYLTNELPKSQADSGPLKANGAITRKYLQVYCKQSPAFNKFRGGDVAALNQTLQSLIDQGYLAEIKKEDAVKNYKFHGKCYQILNLPETNLGDH